MSEVELSTRLLRAETDLRIAYIAISILGLFVVSLCVWQAWTFHRLAHPDTLTLRRLDIVDQHGVIRWVCDS
jgi:hypothetical protein